MMNKEKINIKTNPQEADNDSLSVVEAKVIQPYYEDDYCQIYNNDCLNKLDSLTPSVDCVILDPPYSSGTRQSTNRNASNIPKRGEKWSRAGVVWDTSFSTFGLSMLMNNFYRKYAKKYYTCGALVIEHFD